MMAFIMHLAVVATLLLLSGCTPRHFVSTKRSNRRVTCGNEWIQFGRSCYYFVDYHGRFWDEAGFRCASDGAHTVSIETKSEMQFLADRISKLSKPSAKEMWWTSGMLEDKKRPRWIWEDGIAGRYINMSLFHPGQPDNSGGIEYYVSLQFLGGEWGLNDVSHESVLHSICEYELGSIDKRSSGSCPPLYEQEGQSCYRFHLDIAKAWRRANTACNDEGAHLVAIDSEDEYSWVTSKIAEKLTEMEWEFGEHEWFWTGGRRNPHDEESWYWKLRGDNKSDNMATLNNHWQENEPNNANRIEFYISLLLDGSDWGFIDAPENYRLRYVCEVKL